MQRYDLVCGTGASDSYICRIDSKKKTKKLFTKGRNPVLIGKKYILLRLLITKNTTVIKIWEFML